jgi:mRNA-degrading endonuclease RelE of RelBE toxin-antitoxin system
MFKVAWKEKAYRQLTKIGNRQDRETVYDAAGNLVDWPDCRNVRPLVNHKYGYRLRVGRYRVFFDVRDMVRIIEIQEVKKRDEHTY